MTLPLDDHGLPLPEELKRGGEMWEWREHTSRSDGDVAIWLNEIEHDVVFVAMAYAGNERIVVVAKVRREKKCHAT